MIIALFAFLVAFVLIVVLPIFATIKSLEALKLAQLNKQSASRLGDRVLQIELAQQAFPEPIPKPRPPARERVDAFVGTSPKTALPAKRPVATPVETQHENLQEANSPEPFEEIQFIEPTTADVEHKTPTPGTETTQPKPKKTADSEQSTKEIQTELVASESITAADWVPNPYDEREIVEKELETTVAATSNATPSESFELRLGTYWFVRIGVLLLLSGLAFLAYAKRQFFYDLSPEARVAGFYLFSVALAATGWWIQRVNETFKNYGQVLMAGGFAGLYFTTYAAHVIEPVLVFPNQTIVIVMLLTWGACLFFYSNWIQSETLAVFATGASYFATYLPLIHTPATDQWIILASNLILASTSVFFFLKNRWFKISVVSMLASYGGMTFCIARLGLAQEWLVVFSVAILWGMYTFATFISRNEQFNDIARSVFATVNNFIAASLTTYVAWISTSMTVWQCALLGGVILLACSIAIPYVQTGFRVCRNSYLSQGILLANLGFISMNLEGSFLGPIIATQLLMLMVFVTLKRDQFVEALCMVLAVAAMGFTLFDLAMASPYVFAASITVSVLLLVAGIIYSRKDKVEDSVFRVKVTAYTLFSIGIFTTGLLYQGASEQFATWIPFVFLIVPVAFQASHRAHRVPEFTILWSCLSILGIGWGAFQMLSHAWDLPMALVTAATLLQMHLWKYVNRDLHAMNEKFASCIEKTTEIATAAGVSLLVLAGVAGIGLSVDGRGWSVNQDSIFWVGPLMAAASIGLVVYGRAFSFFWLAVISQIVLVFSAVEMVRTACFDPDANPIALSLLCVLAPLAHLLICNIASNAIDHPFFTAARRREFLVAQVTLLSVVSSSWVYCHVPATFHVLWLVLLTMSLFVFCEKYDKGKLQWQAAITGILAVAIYAYQMLHQQLSVTSLTSLFAVMLIQQIARSNPKLLPISETVHRVLMISFSVLIFFSVTIPSDRFHLDQYFYSVTLVWTCLGAGFLMLGLFRGERVYRMMGLVVWAFALTSLVPAFLGMSTEMKIASTFVLGSVFILAGYFYTKYKDQIRDLI